MSEEKVEQTEEEKGKTAKKFAEHLGKLDAVLGRSTPKKANKKIPQSAVASVVEKLFKKEEEEALAEVEEGLKKALDSYAEYIKQKAIKEKEMAAADEKAMKEFIEVTGSLFQRIDGLPELQKVYIQGLTVAVSGQK